MADKWELFLDRLRGRGSKLAPEAMAAIEALFEGPKGDRGAPGRDGKEGERGADGRSIRVFEQATEPQDAAPGDIWIVP